MSIIKIEGLGLVDLDLKSTFITGKCGFSRFKFSHRLRLHPLGIIFCESVRIRRPWFKKVISFFTLNVYLFHIDAL